MRDFQQMPRVELHLHLEGAIPLGAMWQLVLQHPGGAGLRTKAELADRFAYRDFAHFIDVWTWKNQFLDSYEAFTFISRAVAADLAAQNITYAEVFFSPSDFAGHGLEPAAIAAAIRKGLDEVAGTTVRLIVDVVRDTGPDRARRTLEAVAEVADEAEVIGITIGGMEAEYPAGLFRDVYRKAADLGLRLTAHAGEAAGPHSVRAALDVLGVERIGHGIRSTEDPELMDRLVSSRVPLEVCPTSNLRTGVVDDWESHPARKLIDAGAMVTLNSDDPAMFDCTLADEYAVMAERFGYGDGVIRRLALNAVEASWAEPHEAAALSERIRLWWDDVG